MTNQLKRTIIYCGFLFLAACFHGNLTNHFSSCISSCKSRLVICTKSCCNNCPRCIASARQNAGKSYKDYEHNQYVQGKIIARELNSFRDPLQCRNLTCNCPSDYKICVQACGGHVVKKLEHAPLCS